MNPPSALAGAMGRERKPFTYTPGGLDLSEIKSERMAQRLMRNALNQGVPETPVQTLQSPPPSATLMAMPNFNCLPVQVFPTFNLPANPKTLLRTRSNPDPNEKGPTKADKHNVNEPTACLNRVIGNNKVHKYDDYNSANNVYNTQKNYGCTPSYLNSISEVDSKPSFGTDSDNKPYDSMRPIYFNGPTVTSPSIQTDCVNISDTWLSIPSEEYESQNKKKEVTVTKERTKKEINSSNRNGDTEAAITVKLPAKKSEAKTETKVEVVKNTLPDGSVQEIKTTTTKTTVDGRTEIKTETETTTYPKDYEEGVEYEEEVVEEEDEETDDKDDNHSSEIVQEVTVNQNSANETVSETNGDIEISRSGESNDKELSEEQNVQLIIQEEKHESSTTKKVVIQSESQDSEEEVEEEEEEEIEDNAEDVNVEEVIILRQVEEKNKTEEECNPIIEKTDDKELEETMQELKKDVEEIDEEDLSEKYEDVETEKPIQEEECEVVEEEEEEEEEYEEVEDVVEPEQAEKTKEVQKEKKNDKPLESELLNDVEKTLEPVSPKEAEKSSMPESIKEDEVKAPSPVLIKDEEKEAPNPELIKEEEVIEKTETQEKEVPIKVVIESENEVKQVDSVEVDTEKPSLSSTINIPLREPSIPLEKVEEVEIKPIGPAKEIITKTTTEIITKSSDKPVGTHSTQTEYNIVENIVTVNRTTKTLDHAYEEIPDNIPTNRPFVSSTLDRTLMSPQLVYKPYQPVFTPDAQTERRHSLLLDRISVDRQMPSDIYQNSYQSNQSFEERQWSQEPQSEVLTVSNVKPSTVSKNQQWYQRNEIETSYPTSLPTSDIFNNQYQNQSIYNSPNPAQTFYQPKPTQPTSQPIYQPQPRIQPSPQPVYHASLPLQQQNTYQPKPQRQPSPQPTYQQSYAQPTVSLTQFQSSYQPPVQPVQSLYQPEPQYQSKYLESSTQSSYKSTSNKYQPSQPTYASKPVWSSQSIEPHSYQSIESNQYSYQGKDSSESIQQSTQQLSSSYVPPPWEKDPNYVANNSSQFQATPTTLITPSKEWKPPKPVSKFSKSTPTSYIPPAPNQSFVKPVNTVEPPRQPGLKTYYSEYERRYISVPETTYIPPETKNQPQPDPSPQYYYDNNEPAEIVEPQWRKELREFKEQSETTIQTENTTVRPPWENDPKYAAPKDLTPTPTWTQTLKPRSWRERSYEPEYIGSQEWPKTNTLGRGRPQSSYVKGNLDRARDRTRGVSVDRYNPNSYQSPLTKEHPPVPSHILDPIVQGKAYQNPNLPAYHSRASAEYRDQPVSYQQPRQRESRATPVQSRSFKYLQWITGTED